MTRRGQDGRSARARIREAVQRSAASGGEPPAVEAPAERRAADQAADDPLFRARELIDGERYDEALPLLEAALEADPKNAELARAVAACAFRAGEFERAEELYASLLQSDPNDAEAAHYLQLAAESRGVGGEQAPRVVPGWTLALIAVFLLALAVGTYVLVSSGEVDLPGGPGGEVVRVPQISRGEKFSRAAARLRRAPFRVDRIDQPSIGKRAVRRGRVIDVHPSSGTRWDTEFPVQVVVSSGRLHAGGGSTFGDRSRVPEISPGATFAAAAARLKRAGFRVDRIDQPSIGEPAVGEGLVMDVLPSPGTPWSGELPVKVFVSTGPPF